MCYNISILSPKETISVRFNATFEQPDIFTPYYHVSSFTLPQLPVITQDKPSIIQLFTWGLVPFWVKSTDQMEEIREKTMNARAESIYDKPAYRHAAKQHHCLVLIDGFFEWREVKGRKYPYYIRLKTQEPFAVAGLWESWSNKENETEHKTFTIITCEANPLLAKIHNTKKRMPVILEKELEREWINSSFSEKEFQQMLTPIDDNILEAYPISKLITAKDRPSNVPQVIQPVHYQELDDPQSQSTLF